MIASRSRRCAKLPIEAVLRRSGAVSMAQMARKADVQVREDLLRYLDAPLGSVVVARRPTLSGSDVIVVRMTASNAVPEGRRPSAFDGFKVDYEVIAPSKLGAW